MLWSFGTMKLLVLHQMLFSLSSLFIASLYLGGIAAQFSRPCTGLKPLSLLQYLVPDRNRLPAGIEIVYDEAGGVHAFRFQPGVQTFSFPAASLFTQCDFFPEEFSVLMTLKMSKVTHRRNECIFALISAATTRVKVGVQLRKGRLQVDYVERFGKRRRMTEFKSVRGVFDGAWHTLVFVVTSDRIGLRVDCGKRKYRRLRRRFPSLINAKEDNLHIANCNSLKRGFFTGLIKDLVLLPGSDISSLACRSKSHALPELDLPDPNVPGTKDGGISSPFYPDATCTWLDTGKIAYDVHRRSLQVCFSGIWQQIIVPHDHLFSPRMDYVVWHQDLVTAAPTLDLTVFRIPDEGIFLATASFDSRELRKQQSTIFRWDKNRFTVYQSLYTLGAQSWEHFQIGKQSFLAVANLGSRSDRPSKSVVYIWNKPHRRFQLHQELVTWTARDIEYFQMDGKHFLAVANYAIGSNCSVNSVVYQWNETTRQFVSFQNIPTIGAYDWTHFQMDEYHFLALASSCFRSAIDVNSFSRSVILLWQNDEFIHFQTIETSGASDWEFFSIKNDFYLAVANTMGIDRDDPYVTNSSIYVFNKSRKVFAKYQDIVTYSALDWEAFSIGEDHYIVVSNSQRGRTHRPHKGRLGTAEEGAGRYGSWVSSTTTRSVIYRWQGVERFVPVHYMETLPSSDWETFSVEGDVYLVYANDRETISQVLKVKMV